MNVLVCHRLTVQMGLWRGFFFVLAAVLQLFWRTCPMFTPQERKPTLTLLWVLQPVPAHSIWRPTHRTCWKSRWTSQAPRELFSSGCVPALIFSHYLWQDLSSPVTSDTDSSVSCKDPEDIPTFDEWKRKVMEVEKEKSKMKSWSWF